jgi:hypothetical protein
MTEQKEVRIPFSDLSSMVIECQVASRFVLILLKTRRPTRTGIAICFPAQYAQGALMTTCDLGLLHLSNGETGSLHRKKKSTFA